MPFSQRTAVRIAGAATGVTREDAAIVVDLSSSGATGVVSSVTYTPDAAYTGAATNYRSFVVRNKGQAGAGTLVVAQRDGINAVNLVAFDEQSIALSGTAANLIVTHGDVLSYYSLVAGTGLADPGGLLTIAFSRD